MCGDITSRGGRSESVLIEGKKAKGTFRRPKANALRGFEPRPLSFALRRSSSPLTVRFYFSVPLFRLFFASFILDSVPLLEKDSVNYCLLKHWNSGTAEHQKRLEYHYTTANYSKDSMTNLFEIPDR